MRILPRLAACLLLTTTVAAQTSSAPSAALAFDASRLDRLSGFLQRAVDSNRIGGAVALVVRDGRTVYERAVGFSDRESGKRMAPDALFRIASQTKALTSVAVMILVEEGRIALSNPVSRFIPAFDTTWVLAPGDTGMAAVRATRRITIRDLLTQTAGISYGTDARLRNAYAAKGLGPAAGWGWYTADKDEPVCATMERLATLPFARQPGEAWVYGYATDILGCVVERASGMTLDDFFHARISGPLGMRDTWFFVPPAARPRLVTVYASRDGAAVRAPDGALGQGHYDRGPMRNFAGGAGLVSTARDYARFLQMLLNGGALDGVRILSPKSVDVMTSNQTGSLYHPQQSMSFGLGFSIVERPGADNSLSSVGTWGWGGAYGSQYRVDPRERLVMVLMMNQMPNQSDVATKFSTLVYQALVR